MLLSNLLNYPVDGTPYTNFYNFMHTPTAPPCSALTDEEDDEVYEENEGYGEFLLLLWLIVDVKW